MEKENFEFNIDEKMINGATSYIPLIQKRAIVKVVAEACLETADKTTENIATESNLPIPQLYREKCGVKQFYLMYYFLTEYLHIEIKDDFNEEQYDCYASSHIFNQLERFKSKDTNIKNKVFDILYDYKELKKMLDTEIFNLKEMRNDALIRLQDSISLFASPDNIKILNDFLSKTIEDVEVAQRKLGEKRGKSKETETAEKNN